MLSILGIVLGVAFFVFIAYKGVNLVMGAILSTCIMVLFGGLPLMDVLTGSYVASEGAAATGFMTFVAAIIKSFGLLFIFSSLLGRILADSGAARRIALALTHSIVDKASEKNKMFSCILIVPVLYFILSFIGISGFVTVFTVMPIAVAIFEQTNTPWKFYAFGGPQAVGASILCGSLQVANIYAADVCGTSTTAAAIPSIVAVVFWWIATLVLIKVLLKKGLASGETFATDGAACKESGGIPSAGNDENLPNIWLSIIPLVLVIVLSAGFKLAVVPSLIISCIVAIALFWKQLKGKLKGTVANGVSSCFGALLTVACTFAMGSVIKILPGFEIIMGAMNGMNGIAAGLSLSFVAAFIMCDVGPYIAAFGTNVLEYYTSAGISTAMSHRLLISSGFTAMGPHNPGIANACAVTKIAYKRCVSIYLLATWIPGACATIALLVMALVL